MGPKILALGGVPPSFFGPPIRPAFRLALGRFNARARASMAQSMAHHLIFVKHLEMIDTQSQSAAQLHDIASHHLFGRPRLRIFAHTRCLPSGVLLRSMMRRIYSASVKRESHASASNSALNSGLIGTPIMTRLRMNRMFKLFRRYQPDSSQHLCSHC